MLYEVITIGEQSWERALKNKHDMTRPPDLKHGQFGGPRRIQRPVYVDLLPPCNNACPAGENIQGWLALAQQGQFEEAWQLLMADNPMPGVHGRVCYHPCENECNRTRLDATVSIHAVERFLGEQALANNWKVRMDRHASGKRVLIVRITSYNVCYTKLLRSNQQLELSHLRGVS